MSLEQTILSILHGIRYKPIGLGLDVADHLLSGYTLTQIFLPHIQKSKKIALSLLGALPDIDILTFGLIKHRTITHGGGFLFELTAITLAGRSSYGSQDAFKYSLLATGFIGSHLLIDHCKTNEERLLYFLATGAVLTGTVLYNKAKNRYFQKPKEKIIPTVIVARDDGNLYSITEFSMTKNSFGFAQARYNSRKLEEDPELLNSLLKNYSVMYVQGTGYLENDELKSLKYKYKKEHPPKPSIFDKIDKKIDFYLNSFKNLWKQKVYKYEKNRRKG